MGEGPRALWGLAVEVSRLRFRSDSEGRRCKHEAEQSRALGSRDDLETTGRRVAHRFPVLARGETEQRRELTVPF